MVSCVLQGGLGNCLFITATTLAYSLKHNMNYYIPVEVVTPHTLDQKPYIFPNINYTSKELNLPIYKEPHFHYADIPYMKDICLHGYWQSDLYFKEYRNEILKAFNLDWRKYEGVVSVQIRRGDYLSLADKHPVVTKEYIEEAMSLFPNYEFAIFSDDKKWCIDNFGSRKDCVFESSDDEVLDLINASCCEHNISSNSSYGWWMHWLNQNTDKKGVFPKKWFGNNMPKITKDVYPENAIIL